MLQDLMIDKEAIVLKLMQKELKKMRAESLERQGRLDEAKVLRYEIDQMNND